MLEAIFFDIQAIIFLNYNKMSDDNYYNNKGQQDRSEGQYSPPSTWEEREEYDKAWEVTKAQEDANEGKYSPPSNLDEREAYEKSWDDTRKNNK